MPHWTDDLTNVSDSVRQRLRNVARDTNENMQVVPHDDGLAYDADSLEAEDIQLDAEYSGVRLRLVAMLGRTKINTQIDLGFSEAVVEEPVKATLPVLLDFEPPEIKAYSPEVVFAEKLEAIVKLGTVTTRFKDFFDLYLLSNEKHFDGPTLLRQVRATFDHRRTVPPEDLPVALADEFAESHDSQRQWKAFIRRNDAGDAPEQFAVVVERLRDFVHPVLQAAAEKDGRLDRNWNPVSGWVRG